MAEIRRQLRQQALHIRALAIPANQARQGERMPKIMQPRLVASPVNAAHPGLLADLLERLLGAGARGALASTRQKERSVRSDRRTLAT